MDKGSTVRMNMRVKSCLRKPAFRLDGDVTVLILSCGEEVRSVRGICQVKSCSSRSAMAIVMTRLYSLRTSRELYSKLVL